MNIQQTLSSYLDYCKFRKELDAETLKAYRIDLQQYFAFVAYETAQKDKAVFLRKRLYFPASYRRRRY